MLLSLRRVPPAAHRDAAGAGPSGRPPQSLAVPNHARLRAQDLREVARRPAQQRAEGVLCLLQAGLQRRDRRLGPQQLGARLEHVELSDIAAAEPGLGDLNRTLLDGDIFARDLELRLRVADGDVGVRDLRDEQHQRVVVAGDGGQQVGVGGFDRAPELAPEIEFPADAGADVIFPIAQVSGRRVGGVLAGRRIGHAAVCLLDLRVEVAHCNPQLRARLQHLQACDLQAVVVLIGDLDQLAEDRVAESFPPPDLLSRLTHDDRTVGLLPLPECGRFGLHEVGAHRRAAREGQHQGDQCSRAQSIPSAR